jgi:hypothetical protein
LGTESFTSTKTAPNFLPFWIPSLSILFSFFLIFFTKQSTIFGRQLLQYIFLYKLFRFFRFLLSRRWPLPKNCIVTATIVTSESGHNAAGFRKLQKVGFSRLFCDGKLLYYKNGQNVMVTNVTNCYHLWLWGRHKRRHATGEGGGHWFVQCVMMGPPMV